MRQKKGWIVAAVILAVIVLAGVWTVWPKSWNDLSGNIKTNSLAGSLRLRKLNTEGENALWQSDVWQLTAEEAEGPAADAILDALNAGTYRGRLKNMISYTMFRRGNSSYSIDRENSKGEVNLILVGDDKRSVSLTVFSGGMVVFKKHISRTGTLFFDTDPQVYEALSAVLKEYGSVKEG